MYRSINSSCAVKYNSSIGASSISGNSPVSAPCFDYLSETSIQVIDANQNHSPGSQDQSDLI